MGEDINALRELAEKATPGPWISDPGTDDTLVRTVAPPRGALGYQPGDGVIVGCSEWIWTSDDDAAFIAAANPSAILDLLARLSAAEAQGEALVRLTADMTSAIDWLAAGGDTGTVCFAMTKARDIARRALEGAKK